MKLLKISENKGHFLKVDEKFETIDKIAKEDILRLVDRTLNREVDFDEYDDDTIKDQSHQIIYKSIYNKLISLKERNQEFLDESQRLFLKEHQKYKASLSSEDAETE